MNILFTCVGRRHYLLRYFKENMSPEDKIIGTDMQMTSPALQLADEKVIVPPVYDPNYIQILLDICKKYSVKAIISLNDLELPILSENKSLFEEIGVIVIVSSKEVIDICFDKYKTAQFINSIGLKSPKTFISLDETMTAINNGDLHFPIVMKPRWGSGSIGIEIVDDEEEMHLVHKLLSKKIKKSILSTASGTKDFIIFQEKLVGQEYGLDVMNNLNGDNVGVAVKKKLAMRAGETDKATVIKNDDLSAIGKVLGERLHHIGNLDVDIMTNSNGEYCVLELNPRFGGGFPFSYEAGVNFPKAIIKCLKNEEFDISELTPIFKATYSKCDILVKVQFHGQI